MKKPLFFAPRPTLLVIALLAACSLTPAYAGQACDLIDGDPAVEDAGGSTASNMDAFACGLDNNADGELSVAVGNNNQAGSDFSVAVGGANTIGNLSAAASAFGVNNTVFGLESTALGFQNTVNGALATAVGHGNNAVRTTGTACARPSVIRRAR